MELKLRKRLNNSLSRFDAGNDLLPPSEQERLTRPAFIDIANIDIRSKLAPHSYTQNDLLVKFRLWYTCKWLG